MTNISGKPIGADLTSNYLTVFTMNGYIKLYDVSRHEPKPLTNPKSCYDLFGNFGEVIMAKCNANGTFVAITIATESLIPDGKLYVWSIERDLVSEFNFIGNRTETSGLDGPRYVLYRTQTRNLKDRMVLNL